MLYHELCVDAREFLLWYDKEFVKNSDAAISVIIDIINQRPSFSQENRELVKKLQQMIFGRNEKLQIIIKQNYVEKLEEKIKNITEKYSKPQAQALFRQWENTK